MYYHFFIEDVSGGKAMNILAQKLLDNTNFSIKYYKGIGHIPKGLKPKTDASKRILLDQLPKILCGCGKVPNFGTIVIICDLDDRDKKEFLSELNNILNMCDPKPPTIFCLAVEEFEAWYLGDFDAINKAYPKAKENVLSKYKNDSICGTWELLADAIYPGGAKALKQKGWQAEGKEKSKWAETISPHMDINMNKSPSFCYMREKLRDNT